MSTNRGSKRAVAKCAKHFRPTGASLPAFPLGVAGRLRAPSSQTSPARREKGKSLA